MNLQNDSIYIITEEEKQLARKFMDCALKKGVSAIRVSLAKNTLDTYSMFNGEIDKVTRCSDKSVMLYLFIDGRYGSYSTNKIDAGSIESFIEQAIDNTLMLAEDKFRMLASPDRTARDAVKGDEAGLYDREYYRMSSEDKRNITVKGSIFANLHDNAEYSIISEECEYSDSIEDSYIIDSQGFEGRHIETSFSYWSEMTIEDKEGNKYSGYSWESSPRLGELNIEGCSRDALEKAARQINPQKFESGTMTMVLDANVSSRVVAPILSALQAGAIQQQHSFLMDCCGKEVFPKELTLTDMARDYGKPGVRLFDTEGVATTNHNVIENGVVKEYFANTYIAGKMGISPTIEGVSRPVIQPFVKTDHMKPATGKKEYQLDDIIRLCGDGILVTGFNGGNCNQGTGDFSYGVEGFVFKNGSICYPVKEMLISGNMLELWSRIIAAGNDAKKGTRWQIPSLAFENVDFSA